MADGLAGTTSNPYEQFKLRYWNDPVGFAEDCVAWRHGEGLADYQREALAALIPHQRVCVRAPHGVGKSTIDALTLLWFALTRDGKDWKAPTTASSWHQLTRYLWPEVHKWARRLRWDRIGRPSFNERTELLTLNLNLATGSAFAFSATDPALVEGAHADHMLFMYDEAKAIADATFDSTEGAFSGAGADTGREAFALVTSTPGKPAGRFHAIQARKPGTEQWWVKHITLREAIAAGRISQLWARAMRRLWGRDSALYQNRVLGEFADDQQDGVIPLSWVERAQARWRELRETGELEEALRGRLTAVGVDVADGGAARSIRANRKNLWIIDVADISSKKHGQTMALAGRVKKVIDRHGGLAVVDGDGVGSGVFSRLDEQDVPCVAFRGAVTKDRRGRPFRDDSGVLVFDDVRSAAWWKVRDLFNPEHGHDVALYADETRMTADGESTLADRILGDLTAPTWDTNSSGQTYVERKKSVVTRIKRTLDCGDAVVMAYWADGDGGDAQREINDTTYVDDDESDTILGEWDDNRF